VEGPEGALRGGAASTPALVIAGALRHDLPSLDELRALAAGRR
jgi:hypothetical protein